MQLRYIKTNSLPIIEFDGSAITGEDACLELDESDSVAFSDSLSGWYPYEQLVYLGLDTPHGREFRAVVVDDEMITYTQDAIDYHEEIARQGKEI